MILFLAGILSACGLRQPVEEDTTFSLYYVNPDKNQLVTLPYKPEGSNTDAMVQEIIAKHLEPAPSNEVLPLLPNGTEIQSYLLDGTTLQLDFNAVYSDIPMGQEVLYRGGIVRQFLQVTGVDRVVFYVDGKPLKDSYGNEIGAMTNESFVENSASTINAYQSATMTLYFTDSTGTKLLPESRKAYYISSEPLEWAVVEEIQKGPRLQGRYATYGAGSKVLSVITQDGVCYVNLETSGMVSPLNVAEDVQIYSIVNSLIDTCGVSKVQFSIDGDSSAVFREKISLSEQFTKNEELIARE